MTRLCTRPDLRRAELVPGLHCFVDSLFWNFMAAASSPIRLRCNKGSGLLNDPHVGVLGINLKTITRDVLAHADEAMGAVRKGMPHFCVYIYIHRCGFPVPLHTLVNLNIPRCNRRSYSLRDSFWTRISETTSAH